MNIFDLIPQELFSILASPNKAVYADALLVLYDAFQENLKIPKDTLYTMIRSRLENALVYSSFDDEGIEEEEAKDLSGKARFLIRKLKEKGWIDIERDDDFFEYIIIPEYSIKIMELLKSLIDGERSGGFSYVYDTYSALKFVHEDMNSTADEKLSALNTAYDKTTAMAKTLRKIYHNINRYVGQLIDNDDINEILIAHYDDFYHRIIENHIQPLKIKDSIPKYKKPIQNVLDAWLDSEALIDGITNASRSEKQCMDEQRHEIVSKIYFIRESYETIEHEYLDEIDEKIRKYTRATTRKIEYLTNTDRTVQGNLIYMLNALAHNKDDDSLLEKLQSTFDLYEQRYLSENGLYHNRKAQKKIKTDPVLIYEPSDDLRGRVEEEYNHILNSRYSKHRVWEYMDNMFGKAPVVFSGDMNICDDHTYILSLLAVLYGNDRGASYKPVLMGQTIDKNAYAFPEIRFERKNQQ